MKKLLLSLLVMVCFRGTGHGQVTILATNQGEVGNIIVDGSRVYWINFIDSTVSSVDKVNGGPVLIHNPATGVTAGDIVQDNVKLYFTSQTSNCLPGTYNIYSVPKTSSLVTQLTIDTPCDNGRTNTDASDGALAISNGSLYYLGPAQDLSPPTSNLYSTIVRISTQGGVMTQVIPFSSSPPPPMNPYAFDTDNVYLHWSDLSQDAILRVPLAGASTYSYDAGAPNTPWVLSTPANGPAGGYHFWVEGDNPNAVLMEQTPGGVPFPLLSGVENTGYHSFVVVNSFIYCIMGNGTITQMPIFGGTPVTVVDALDAFAAVGLTSDGTYLYWTAGGDGSIRRVGIVPTPPHPPFFNGETALGNGVYYLQFPNGTPFGYYTYLTDPRFIYHFDMGYEYWFDANDGHNGIYFYDFMSNHFFYTSPSFPFPYLYDFSLNSVLYYYPDSHNPGHYTTNPRYFYNFATGQIITM